MKDILSKIVVTKTTLFLAVISVAAIIINHYASLNLIATLNDLSQNQEQNPTEVTNTLKSLQQYNLWVTMPLLLISWFLPLFWAWQNYKVFKQIWLFVAAGILIISSFHYIAGIAVLLLYLKSFWQEFSSWRTNTLKNS
jgi:hypothetical protein